MASMRIRVQPGQVTAWNDTRTDIQEQLSNTKKLIENQRTRWDTMKRSANPYEAISAHNMIDLGTVRPVSRSYFKMWEMMHEFPELQKALEGRVACAAEGPGGFVQATLGVRPCHVDVITLLGRQSPALRVVDDNVTEHTVDGTGDICKPRVAREFVRLALDASLFTADGGFDVHGRFEEQEERSLALIRAEVLMGIAIVRQGGCMIVKFYDVFLDGTKALIEWLHACFSDVYVYKPCTSRPANSERYMVCLYKRENALSKAVREHFRTGARLPSFRDPSITRTIDNLNSVFGYRQLTSINAALCTHTRPDEKQSMYNILQWCHRYNMKVKKSAILKLKAMGTAA